MGMADANILCILSFAAGEWLLGGATDSTAAGVEDGSAAGRIACIRVDTGMQPLKLKLVDRSIVYDGELRLRRAFFVHGCVLNEKYVGIFHLDGSVLGIVRLGRRTHVIRSRDAGGTCTEDLATPEMVKGRVVIVRLLLINDAGRTARLGSRVLRETLDIFRGARRIFEGEDWGGYKIRLKLSNIYSIEERPGAQAHRRAHVRQSIPSDSTEDESGRGTPPCKAPCAWEDVSRARRRYKEELASMADTLESILSDAGRADEFHEQQDVVFVVSSEKNRDVEGLSYDGCAFGPDMCLGIVFAGNGGDSSFHGRVLAHEIGHGQSPCLTLPAIILSFMKVRKMELLDIEPVKKVNEENLPENYTYDFYRYYLLFYPGMCYVAEDDTGVAGYVLSKLSSVDGVVTVHITSICVSREHRKRGVGTALMQSVISCIRDRYSEDASMPETCRLSLYVRVSNEDAIRFYENKFGFRKQYMQENYYGDGESAYEMALVLSGQSMRDSDSVSR
ncbi:UNVERIFIED_CONTAM: hypothetical protein PYX00_011310 [Menopon gallinae]|uniref:N-terminal amino-acid N(alpha)-acetyltransferase NatA n=1 Tax=Menopon gallinae TaxID=328185 RepID=A0AAW2H7B4_9NEOP